MNIEVLGRVLFMVIEVWCIFMYVGMGMVILSDEKLRKQWGKLIVAVLIPLAVLVKNSTWEIL